MDLVQKSKLVLVSGPPGVGKSTLSKALAKKLKLVHLDKDCVDEPFSPGDRGDHYSQFVEPKVLQALLNLARLNLSNGMNVILDVPWSHILLNTPSWQTELKLLCEQEHSDLLVYELIIPEAELRERMTARGLERDKTRLTDEGWQKFKQVDRLDEVNPLNHLPLDATLPREVIFQQAVSLFNKH